MEIEEDRNRLDQVKGGDDVLELQLLSDHLLNVDPVHKDLMRTPQNGDHQSLSLEGGMCCFSNRKLLKCLLLPISAVFRWFLLILRAFAEFLSIYGYANQVQQPKTGTSGFFIDSLPLR
jgi:hypothetical protein